MARIPRTALIAAVALAAAVPALSFTAIEFKNTGFMDYTDDARTAVAPDGEK